MTQRSTKEHVIQSGPPLRWLFCVERPPGRAERTTCVMSRRLNPYLVEQPGRENFPIQRTVVRYSAGHTEALEPGLLLIILKDVENNLLQRYLERRRKIFMDLCKWFASLPGVLNQTGLREFHEPTGRELD